MFLLSEPKAVRRAMRLSGKRQEGFAKELGKSQAQISKYISGESKPTTEIYIHCMNIIFSKEKGSGSLFDLISEVSELSSDQHKSMRKALIEMIKAYKSQAKINDCNFEQSEVNKTLKKI